MIRPVVHLSCNAPSCAETAIVPIAYTDAAAALLGVGIPTLPEGWEASDSTHCDHRCPYHNAVDRVVRLIRTTLIRVELSIGGSVEARPMHDGDVLVGYVVTVADFKNLTVSQYPFQQPHEAALHLVGEAGWRDVLKAVKANG